MTAAEVEPFRWGPYVDPLECDLCWVHTSGCPFHPDNDLAARVVEGLRRWAYAMLWESRRLDGERRKRAAEALERSWVFGDGGLWL